MTKKEKYKGKTGYTLHARRLEYTAGEALRTVKLPLDTKNSDLKKEIVESIHHDYVSLYGNININDFVNQKNGHHYCLLDFWMDSLRAGIIFQSSTNYLKHTVCKILGEEDCFQEIFNSIPEEYRTKLDEEKFIDLFLINTGIRATKSKESLEKSIFDTYLTKPEKDDPKIKRLLEELPGASKKEQKKIICEVFGITKDLPESEESLSFFPLPILKLDPSLTINELMLRLKEVDDILSNNKGGKQQNKIKRIQELAGLEGKFNAFSNYFNSVLATLKKDDGLAELEKSIKSISSKAWGENTQDLHNRLIFLAEKAKEVPEPRLTNTWAGYRGDFGGKLLSWSSNYWNQSKKIQEKLPKQKKEFEEIKGILESSGKYSENIKEIENIVLILDRNLENIEKNGIPDSEALFSYRDLLSPIKSSINEIYQDNRDAFTSGNKTNTSDNKGKKNKKRKDEDNIRNRFPNIFSNLELEPEFFGSSKEREFKKYLNTSKAIDEALNVVEYIENAILQSPKREEATQEDILKRLNSALRLYRNSNTNLYQKDLEALFIDLAGKVPESNKYKEEVFFKSPHSTSNFVKEVEIPDDSKITIKLLEKIVQATKRNVNWKMINNPQLIDFVEGEKLRINTLLFLHPQTVLTGLKERLVLLEKAKKYLDLLGKEQLEYSEIYPLINASIFSELRGFVNKISREFFTVRNVINFEKTEEKFKLVLVPSLTLNTGPSKKSEITREIIKGRKYRLGYKLELPENGEEGLPSTYYRVWESKEAESKDKNGQLSNFLEINTSKYQMQFFDWYLNGNLKKKGNITLERRSPSLILEEDYKAYWNKISGEVNISLKNPEEKQHRIYMSQPFKLTSPNKKDLKSERELVIKNRTNYLGVDIGEYGLAYVVLSTQIGHKKGLKVLEKGFLYDDAYRRIRDEVKELKYSQVRGTFSMPVTKVSRVRENAAHSLRNRLHDIMLKYDAKVIYEFEVSAFEAGSKKIQKLYDTIKIADVLQKENQASELFRTSLWGNKILMGNHISAYATSQTCSKCRKSILGVISEEKEKEKYQILRWETDTIGVARVENEEIWFYLREPKQEKEKMEIEGKRLKEGAQRFMRPPVELKTNGKITGECEAIRVVNAKVPEEFKSKRGNSALFICPFCHHVSDADIQAALNIAYKGYYKSKNESKKSEPRNESEEARKEEKNAFFRSILEETNYPVIELE